MEHYVTLFDALFLPQGIALHRSLERHAGEYRLWVLCVDEQAHSALSKLALPNVSLLELGAVETEELRRVKADRTRAEYCWTLTPFAPRFVFEADAAVQRVTYLDADLWFRQDPGSIWHEFDASGKQVLITEHAYAPEHDQSAIAGRFCVQFMTFTREGGEPVRRHWQDQCIEWCYARYEPGRFGDQMYLDEWPSRFAHEVHVLANKELILAPWNATRFPYGSAVCWHFHALRLMKSGDGWGVDCGHYALPTVTRQFIYLEYLKDLRAAIDLLLGIGVEPRPQKTVTRWGRWRNVLERLFDHRWRLPFRAYYRL